MFFFGPGLANTLAYWGGVPVLVDLINRRFKILKPLNERVAIQDWYATKWDMPGFGKFLLSCDTGTAAAVVNQWHKNGDFRLGGLMEALITAPPFQEQQDAVINLMKLLSFSNPPLILSRIENGKPPEGIFYLKNCMVPPIKNQLMSLNHDKIALLLNIMHKMDPAATNGMMAGFPPPIVMLAKQMIMARIASEDNYRVKTKLDPDPADAMGDAKVSVINSTSRLVGNIADIFELMARRMEDPALPGDTSGDGEGGGEAS